MTRARPVTVLAYHGVADCPREEDPHNLFVSPASFAAQMAYLARRHAVVPLEVAVEGALPRRAVAITFDDGYRSVLEEAGPVLARHGFPATVFVPTRFVGDRARWLPETGCPLEIMDADQLREAERLGIRVESHGDAHLDLAAASRAEVEDDVRRSLERLEELLGRRPRFLAYPFGRSSADAQQAARALGFDAAFTIDALDEGRYAWERPQVTPLDGRLLFALKAGGRYLRLRRSSPVERAYALVKPLARRAR